MGDSVRWYVCKSTRFTGKWFIRSTDAPNEYDTHYYISPKIRVIPNESSIYYVNIYFPTRKAARAALRSYRSKWFGFYAKHWDRKVLRSKS